MASAAAASILNQSLVDAANRETAASACTGTTTLSKTKILT